MKTLVRALLVWFVLLAVPFQGFAAAALRCAHGMAAPAGAPAQPPCHGEGARVASHAPVQASSQDNAHDGASPHQTSCGNCSACSVGAAIAPAANAQAPSVGSCLCRPSAAPAPLALSDPDLPERPPRALA